MVAFHNCQPILSHLFVFIYQTTYFMHDDRRRLDSIYLGNNEIIPKRNNHKIWIEQRWQVGCCWRRSLVEKISGDYERFCPRSRRIFGWILTRSSTWVKLRIILMLLWIDLWFVEKQEIMRVMYQLRFIVSCRCQEILQAFPSESIFFYSLIFSRKWWRKQHSMWPSILRLNFVEEQ